MIDTEPLPTTSISSPAVKLVAVIPLVPPVRLMSRAALAVPSIMLLLATPWVSMIKSRPALAMPSDTALAFTKILPLVVVAELLDALSAVIAMLFPAKMLLPERLPLLNRKLLTALTVLNVNAAGVVISISLSLPSEPSPVVRSEPVAFTAPSALIVMSSPAVTLTTDAVPLLVSEKSRPAVASPTLTAVCPVRLIS